MPRTRMLACVAAALIATITAFAPSADAATWTKITERSGNNLDNPSLLRTPDGVLHLAYVDRVDSLDNGFHYRSRSAAGVWSAPIAIVDHWAGLAEGSLDLVGDQLMAVWGGQGSSAAADGTTTGQAWSATLAGGVWTRSAAPASVSNLPYASSQVSSAVDASGVPWFSWSSTFGVGIHQSFAAIGAENPNVGPSTCCGYASNIARDAATGDLYLVYFSNATGSSGYWSRRIAPTLGDPIKLAGSSRGDDAVGRTKRLAAAARTTGGVFTAYCAQYPSCTSVRVSSETRSLKIATGGANGETVSAAAAPAGRMWLTWAVGSTTYAVRSNKALTKWGPVQKVGAPRGTVSNWYTYGDGSQGPLDLFVNVSGAADNSTFGYTTRVLPALSITASRSRVLNTHRTTITFRVTDAGDATAGKVIFRGITRATNAAGRVTFVVPAGARAGRFLAKATVAGYVAASTPVTVKRPLTS